MINCLDRAYIEVTRRCNMKCAHCLRGPAQNIDLSFEEVDAFLDNFSFINQITYGKMWIATPDGVELTKSINQDKSLKK